MLQFRIEPRDGFILVSLDGLVSAEAWKNALQDLEPALAPLPGNRLIVDLTGILGYLGTPERQQVGVLMATHFRRMSKVALVIQQEKITGVVRGEAQKRGLELRLFPIFDDAAAWVVSE